MQGEVEHFFICPYCSEEVSMLLESYYEQQSYIEDCEVCCQPIKISYTAKDNVIIFFEAYPSNN